VRGLSVVPPKRRERRALLACGPRLKGSRIDRARFGGMHRLVVPKASLDERVLDRGAPVGGGSWPRFREQLIQRSREHGGSIPRNASPKHSQSPQKVESAGGLPHRIPAASPAAIQVGCLLGNQLCVVVQDAVPEPDKHIFHTVRVEHALQLMLDKLIKLLTGRDATLGFACPIAELVAYTS